MNATKADNNDLFENHLDSPILAHAVDSEPLILDHNHDQPFPLPPMSEIVLFRDEDDDDSISHTSSDADDVSGSLNGVDSSVLSHNNNNGHSLDEQNPRVHRPGFINPEPHTSSQFYTFNGESHAMMIRCILEGRLAMPDEIRAVTPPHVLASWRSVWKDRNEDTAYLTAWKRIQEKLNVHVDAHGNDYLCFKNNLNQFVSHVNQWQDIVMSFHGDADLKHLGLKETIERIKQVWTVGAKFYGIPESFIRVCVTACPACSDSSGSMLRNKRRRFEYTESFDVPAKEVPHRLQQLAAKHKVVLCIRQKYIRYKPFMAEVKDYACHRAGEPASSKKSKILKREPYASKRCGCGFRIRAIVPIANYNEKDKTFIYQEEGIAIFKLFAVHSGHEPGPLDGNARIIHRVVGHKGGFLLDQDTVYGISEEMENETLGGFIRKEDTGDLRSLVSQQIQELRNLVGSLEGSISKYPDELLGLASQDLSEIVNKVRAVGEYQVKPFGLLSDHRHDQSDDMLVGENDLAHWGKENGELLEEGEEEESFSRTLGDVVTWDEKDLLGSNKPERWLKCEEESKLRKPFRQDENVVSDVGLVDSFYPENSKWYDSPCGLDSGGECGESGFRHGGIL
ncbi:uncharacterized protein LOC124919446 [Impatiens glandulifera]|uniref:uncharacterized protein LOC124919446 n=1 Tax=Impatiens glandulifera TaxID=253017 RepID=UPI001FB0A838|nr:uncharacterized protein LOC124919446 [Impatiens glandulifera]